MKRILFFLALAVNMLAATAQEVDRTKAPAAGPAPKINIGDAATFTLPNGLKVFVVTNTKLPQVAATLTLDLDPIFEGDKAGYTSIAGALMKRGTTTMSKAQLDEAIDYLGASITTDASSVAGSSLKKNFPKVMALMADVALRPAFKTDELEKVRKQTLSGLESDKDDPSAISRNIGGMLLYGKNHPYGEYETEATVKKITIADVKKYHSTYWKPNVAYLIFVGDITLAEAKQLATQHFGKWIKSVVPRHNYPAVAAPSKTWVAVIDRPASVQSIISIKAPLTLKPGTPDVIPASVMNSLLGDGISSRLNQNLREKHAFTYGAGSNIASDRLVGSFRAGASVRNEKTDSAIGQFLFELGRMRNEAAGDTELTAIKNYISGGFARSLESPATIAKFALNIALFNLPKDYYRNYLTRLSAVGASEVKAVANKFIPVNNLLITIVGNAKEIGPGLEKYGEVKYFDIHGNPIAAPVVKKADAGLTGEGILQKAIEAYGGESKIAALKDVILTGTVSLMGQQFVYEQKHLFPDGYTNAIKMNGMTLMSQSKKGKEYKVTMQGASQQVQAEDAAELDAKAALYEERYYLATAGYKSEVKGIETINGAEAYHVQLTNEKGDAQQLYYDVKSGLKVQEQKEMEAPGMGKIKNTVTFSDYKSFEGIMIPTKLLIDLGVMKQEVNITDVKINAGLKPTEL